MAERRQGGALILVLAAVAAAMMALARAEHAPAAPAADPGFARADALHALGQAALARQRLDDAARALDEARRLHRAQDRSGALARDALALAQVQTRRGQAAEALQALDECVAEARRGADAEIEGRCHLAAARVLARAGDLAGAQRELDDARPRLSAEGDRAWLLYEQGRLEHAAARRRGRPGHGALAVARFEPALALGDDRIAVAVLQARAALAGGDLTAAESWARRAVAAADALGEGGAPAELRPWVRSARREPLEVLFAVLARAGRTTDAAAVLDRWQGRALLDALVRPGGEAGLASAARQIADVERWLPAASMAPLLSPGGRGAAGAAGADDLARRLASIDLLGLAVAEGDVWRLVARGGRLRLDRLGALEAFGDLVERFTAAPTDRAVAGELGARLLPADLVRATGEPLYVVLDEPLAGLPIVALRRDGRPLIAARPVVHLPRLPAGACARRDITGGATVLADAAGELSDTRGEARRIASLLGTTPRVGAAATSAALRAASDDRVLHLAAGEASAGGGLRLRDRSVSALEIAAARLGPRVVVVSAGDPARAPDPELTRALATAFLAGGSSHVVATLRSVSDPGARELADRFYAAGGALDPVRALARLQAELAGTVNPDWPRFAAFGADACAPD